MRVPVPAEAPRTVDGLVDVDAAAAALGDADVLESMEGGWSYLVPRVGPRLVDDGRRVGWWLPDGRWIADGDDPFAALDRWCRATGVTPRTEVAPAGGPGSVDGGPPFTGGMVGALGYDLAARIEPGCRSGRDDRSLPWLSLRVAPAIVAISPDRQHALVTGRPLSAPGWQVDGPATDRLLLEVRRRLAAARGVTTIATPRRLRPATVHSSMSRDAYLTAVTRVLRAIGAGDAFQVNLAHRLSTRTDRTTHQLYADLRAASPAPHGAALADLGIASVSPETFLHVAGGQVTVRPIKGTRARSADPRVDAAQADDLLTSAKDRAENVMVVDLERNDLGRVCELGSVRVPELCRLEGHPTVWHLTSEVTGRLPAGTGYGELLRATFPCGSITGAPKIAAMRLIARLEPVTRGWYCGAIGLLGAGHASLSVAIRTAVRHGDGTVDHAVGAGIVADSDPADEHAETLAKADAFLRAVGGQPTAAVTGPSPRSRRASRAAG